MAQADQCCGEEPQSSREFETGNWGKGKKEQDDGQRASPGPEQIKTVNAIDLILEPAKGETDAVGRTKKGHGQQHIEYQQIERLATIPEYLKGIERNLLCEDKVTHCRETEKQGIYGKGQMKSRKEPTLGHGDKGSASSKAKQGKADNHVGEMVPLDDGKEPHQEDFIADHSSRYQENGIPDKHVNAHR